MRSRCVWEFHKTQWSHVSRSQRVLGTPRHDGAPFPLLSVLLGVPRHNHLPTLSLLNSRVYFFAIVQIRMPDGTICKSSPPQRGINLLKRFKVLPLYFYNLFLPLCFGLPRYIYFPSPFSVFWVPRDASSFYF